MVAGKAVAAAVVVAAVGVAVAVAVVGAAVGAAVVAAVVAVVAATSLRGVQAMAWHACVLIAALAALAVALPTRACHVLTSRMPATAMMSTATLVLVPMLMWYRYRTTAVLPNCHTPARTHTHTHGDRPMLVMVDGDG